MADLEPQAPLEPIVGRYLRLDLAGRPHRVYFEEAGQGIPLLCLHTAGGGKSLPPAGWQDEEYRLTTAGYVDLILTFCRALGLERPVVLGCSIGGKIVLELARLHPERFRALLGLGSPASP